MQWSQATRHAVKCAVFFQLHVAARVQGWTLTCIEHCRTGRYKEAGEEGQGIGGIQKTEITQIGVDFQLMEERRPQG